jgi:hypothetical protein
MMTDDNDQYADSGEAGNAPFTHNVTDAELHDVVAATSAGSELEAIALIEMLEDAGIPAMKHGGLIHLGGFGTSEIMVPRKLLDAAKIEIEKFRGESSERGVEEAFKSENIADAKSDRRRTHDMGNMAKMANMPAAERDNALTEFIAHASADGMVEPELARHLAAAGLNRAESDALIAKVRTQHSHLIRSRLESRVQTGYYMGSAGVIAVLASFYFLMSAGRVPRILVLGWLGLVIGFGLAADAKLKIADLDKK